MREQWVYCGSASPLSTRRRTSRIIAKRSLESRHLVYLSLVCLPTICITDPYLTTLLGVYLTTLTFINDGAGDRLGDNMINFRKRQKAAEVIHDIKRWQSKPYNFQTVASILSYLEECFNKYSDGHDYADQFWNISLEREPREREDEKMARLLQESGFL